ncbi:MAG: hypothetical protein IJ509_04040 [Bacilli bacterium]|nr:hypothetical protein [Bacilli bacterium]
MSDLNNFYQSILNLRQRDVFDTIKTIVLEERTKLNNTTNDLTGFCKYIASQIEDRLTKENIRVYWVDLNDITNVDHVILIAEYMSQSKMNRVLIDPTYSQFTKDDKHQLVTLKEWPSERLDKNILKDLLTNGVTQLDDNKFQNYLNSFGEINWNISLDDYLLKQQLGKGIRR